ncbi:hypothetical protein ACVW0A_004418 [Pseudomonas sp. TE3610]
MNNKTIGALVQGPGAGAAGNWQHGWYKKPE